MCAAGTLLPSLSAFGQVVALQQCRKELPCPLGTAVAVGLCGAALLPAGSDLAAAAGALLQAGYY